MPDIHIATPGVRGHTRSTWRDESKLRGLLLRLMEQQPDAERDELEEKFLAKAQRSPAMVEEALRYAFDNHLLRIQRSQTRPSSRSAEEDEAEAGAGEAEATTGRPRPAVRRTPARRRVTEAELTVAQGRLNVVLLDLVMPNGKPLRDCTGAECRKAGGWLTKVAERVGDRGVVGTTLSEAELVRMRDGGARVRRAS